MKPILTLSALLIVVALIGAGTCDPPSKDPLKDPNFIWREGERLVALRLKDPESARFKGWVSDTGESLVACGEVSARNSFGGYAEPLRWRLNATEGVVAIDGDAAFADAWREQCSAPIVLNKN
jgi:hypothetical protein